MNTKHFNFSFLVLFLLLFSAPRTYASRSKFSSPSSSSHQVFHPWNESPISSSPAREISSQKRRVPSGSNPLHNKR
ncbi:hypothetical protein L6164_031441 [Bauhinia variegata]|uniref:Uncharacterized protein n=1 Tax=Bauhinia variegata TaxID=167791 RepID=A0ACB9LFH1_BAUVA|nr:hypothetical protein L6164_031441 [Bauhinia variegata]